MMDNATWIKHINQWKQFLEIQLAETEDSGLRIKAARQLKTIELVRYSAVLNPKILSDFILSPQAKIIDEEVIDFFLELNESQAEAVKVALGENDIVLIQGPPGTGKTQVIAEMCLQAYRKDPNVRILVCSETHVAVNNLVTRIAQYNSDIRILRVRDKEQDTSVDEYSPKAVVEDYLAQLKDTYKNEDLVSILMDGLENTEDSSLEKALALSANVVGMTCNRVGAYDFVSTTEMFDIVIVDEVCKATLPEILMPLTVARKAVLVGDPRQLPPVFCSEDLEVIRRIEECELQKYMYIDSLFSACPNVCMLNTQYRMSNEIGNLIGELFYDGRLKNGRDVSLDDSIQWIDYLPTRNWPIEENGDKQKLYNIDECIIILDILQKLNKKAVGMNLTVAVITPYSHQKAKIKEFLRTFTHNNIEIDVDTVDGFQGKECDYVVFCLTRTNGSFRFLADARRLNVALSRARNKIIVVGSLKYASKSMLLKRIAEKSVISRKNVRDIETACSFLE